MPPPPLPPLRSQEPTAELREIKAAYYGMMRECHPDRSQDDSSTEFCVLLNDIYEARGSGAGRPAGPRLRAAAPCPLPP